MEVAMPMQCKSSGSKDHDGKSPGVVVRVMVVRVVVSHGCG